MKDGLVSAFSSSPVKNPVNVVTFVLISVYIAHLSLHITISLALIRDWLAHTYHIVVSPY